MSNLDSIVDAWFVKAIEIYPESARGGMMQTGDRFRNPVASTLRESLKILAREMAGGMDDGAVESALDMIVRVRAVQDCKPEEAIGFPAQLRDVIQEMHSEALFPDLEQRLDALSEAARRQYALCKKDIARVRASEELRLRAHQPWTRQVL
jgi:ABC-type phosphate transport system auxiliary subunit